MALGTVASEAYSHHGEWQQLGSKACYFSHFPPTPPVSVILPAESYFIPEITTPHHHHLNLNNLVQISSKYAQL